MLPQSHLNLGCDFYFIMAKKLGIGKLKRVLKIDEDRLDIYLKYYGREVEWEQLTPTQQEMLERYREAWALYCMGRTEEMVRSQLMRKHDLQERQARYIFEESKFIHGRLDQVDKDGRRAASIAFYDLMSNLAMKDKQYETAVTARDKADKLAKLHETDETGLNPDDFIKAAKFIFVNNVNVLKQQQQELDE